MNDTTTARDLLAAVLETHRRDDVAGHCDCGWRTRAIGYSFRHEHEHHVADALAPLIAGWLAEARVEALQETADAWTQGKWADVLLPKPEPPAVPVIAYANRVGDWLRDRPLLKETPVSERRPSS